jgi:hypothetical protein
MKLYFLILCIAITSACTNLDAPKDGKTQLPQVSQINPKGNWKLIQKEIIQEKQSIERYKKNTQPDYPREESTPVFLHEDGVLKPIFPNEYLSVVNQHLHITDDSIYYIHYPIHRYGKRKFSVQGNKICIGKEKEDKSIWISKARDTMKISYLDFYGLYIEETFVKTSFNDEVISVLKAYQTNYPELAGTWHLIRLQAGEYGELYELDFPHQVPDSIILNKDELEAALHEDRSVLMLTDGNKKKYYLGYEDGKLFLVPGKWYDMSYYHNKGYSGDQRLYFSRSQRP